LRKPVGLVIPLAGWGHNACWFAALEFKGFAPEKREQAGVRRIDRRIGIGPILFGFVIEKGPRDGSLAGFLGAGAPPLSPVAARVSTAPLNATRSSQPLATTIRGDFVTPD
jgi:hypothetical protein